MSRKVRVRFAPSPTGPLHMGGVRTALFNYLFAKHHQGDFILRIEDTDQTRYVPGAEDYIMESLDWCGISFDEGIREGGEFGPYRQSERKEMYRKFSDELLEKGHAYIAFDTPEELDALRKEFESRKETFTYNQAIRKSLNNSLKLSREEVENKIASGLPYVVRFKMPENTQVVMNDLIRGEVIVNTSTLDDKVLFKSDGMPTYHLANIVDDHAMEISHVIRGEEWLPSLPLHVLLYDALGWEAPQFAHLPLLLKPTGKGKLSKRDGDKMGFPVFPVEWKNPGGEIYSGYRESGYLPEAFVNLLALLGWNPGTDQEIFSMDQLVKEFSLERVGKSGSRFDPEKAKWFNHQWMQRKSESELAEIIRPLLPVQVNENLFQRVIGLVKERLEFPADFWNQASFFFVAPQNYDEKTVKKRWKENTSLIIQELIEILKEIEKFSSENTEKHVKEWIEAKEYGMGAVMNAFRLCIVGAGKGPHLFDIISIIGKEETLMRLNKAIQEIKR